MSNIVGITHNPQNLAPSYAPLGKPAAGLESPENKDQTLPPVEEANASEKSRNQAHQKVTAASSETDDGRQKNQQQSDAKTESDSREQTETARAAREAEAAQAHAAEQLHIALQRVAALHGEYTNSISGSDAVESFSATAGHTLAPGSLLDQRT